MPLYLVPEPKELLVVKGTCTLDAHTSILISVEAENDLFFAARQLQDEVSGATGLTLPIVKAYAPVRTDNAVLLLCGERQAAAFGADSAVARLHAAPVPGTQPAVAQQAYALFIERGRTVLYADAPAGLFYAVQTLCQLVRLQGHILPTLTIRDWPSLAYRGLLLDISRGKVPRLSTLKHLVRELSQFKLNVLQLYTEHTYRFPRHPQIGAGCGSLSSQDIVELDRFCRQHHVELMPNLQSFSHARNTLRIPDYQHLAETDLLWTLSPAFDETYTLLEELYGDMLPAFSSATFNVGCDETCDLGQGASQAQVSQAGGMPAGVGRVYLKHILRVRDLAARYGRNIQIWGDILLKHPELVGELPDDVTLLDWKYDPADHYPSVETFAQAGQRFWVCPGVGSWNSLFPRLNGARTNIRNLVRAGVAAGAEGTLNTDWGDFGHYQHLGLSWHGYAYGAAQGWTGGRTTDETFDAAFGRLFFGPHQAAIREALDQLARTNDLPGVYHDNCSYTVLALFDEPLLSGTVEGDDALPAATLGQMQVLADAAAMTCDRLAPGHRRELTLREMASAARLTDFAARKTTLAQAIRALLREIAAQPEPASVAARRLYGQVLALQDLAVELEELRAEWEALWLARARRSEIHIALGYFASLRARLDTAVAWLEGQHHALLQGVSVDAELATYEAGDYRVPWHTQSHP